ncbi:thiamine phosphate synthase [Corynebacterium sp. 335C]
MTGRTREQRRRMLADATLYLCTDARADRGDLREFLHAAYAGGVDVIQLRDKKLEARAEIAALEVLAEVAAEHGRLFAANDRADVAKLVGADVFHVGQGDLTTEQARAILGDDVLIGRSNQTEAMFRESMADPGLDYAVIGPVWATPTKPDRAPVGLEAVSMAARVAAEQEAGEPGGTARPWFCIGGVDAARVPDVREAGASRVVVVRAIAAAGDPEAAARGLKAALAQPGA